MEWNTTNFEIAIKILSTGVIASFVTGLFSLIVSMKNNKKLLQLEKQKEKFQMDQKRYDILTDLLEKFEKIQFKFEYSRTKPKQSFQYIHEMYCDSLDVFTKIEEFHKHNSYLIDNISSCESGIDNINKLVSEYVESYKNSNEDDLDEIIREMDKICVCIYKLRNDYISILKDNINAILRR